MASHLRILGRVQGVGYRAWAVREARALQLAGWVRNRADGSVEIAVAGEPSALGRFIRSCGSGPEAARVREVLQAEQPDATLPYPFEARPTA